MSSFAIPQAPSPKPSKPKPICRFFNSSKGCRSGAACRFSHEVSTTTASTINPSPSTTNEAPQKKGKKGNKPIPPPPKPSPSTTSSFLASKSYDGPRQGYKFTTGQSGTGYYADNSKKSSKKPQVGRGDQGGGGRGNGGRGSQGGRGRGIRASLEAQEAQEAKACMQRAEALCRTFQSLIANQTNANNQNANGNAASGRGGGRNANAASEGYDDDENFWSDYDSDNSYDNDDSDAEGTPFRQGDGSANPLLVANLETGFAKSTLSRKETPLAGHSEEECIICLKPIDGDDVVAILPCNETHVFHCQCVRKWLDQNNNCPICRAELSDDFLEGKGQLDFAEPCLWCPNPRNIEDVLFSVMGDGDGRRTMNVTVAFGPMMSNNKQFTVDTLNTWEYFKLEDDSMILPSLNSNSKLSKEKKKKLLKSINNIQGPVTAIIRKFVPSKIAGEEPYTFLYSFFNDGMSWRPLKKHSNVFSQLLQHRDIGCCILEVEKHTVYC